MSELKITTTARISPKARMAWHMARLAYLKTFALTISQ